MASSAALTTTHLPVLRSQLEEWREKQSAISGFSTSLSDIADNSLNSKDARNTASKDVVVAFRTRPPLEHEAEEKFKAYETKDTPEQDGTEASSGPATTEGSCKVEFCPGITVASAEPGTFIAHVPGLKWSGPTLTHKKYGSDLAFAPGIDNEEVYQRTVIANDMISLALSSGTACILAYGQTGSGKTYTMEALEYRIARDLFVIAERIGKSFVDAERRADTAGQEAGHGASGANIFEFSVTFLELLGKRAVDLLEPVDGLVLDNQGNPIRKEIPIHEDKNGDVRPRLISHIFKSSEELQELITNALAHRRTSATARNATSSRSHALLTIKVKNILLPYAEDGQIILVDLAGSERYEDSKGHDKQRMLESRDNNNSLMNLKECVRAKAKMANEEGFVHIPWRSNKLTMLLKSIFDPEYRQPSRALIIAHVSPHIQDSTHSVNTLSYASPFKTSPPKPKGPAPYSPADPRTWNHEQTVTWFTKQFTQRIRARQLNSYNLRQTEAEKKGEKLNPYDPTAPITLPVAIEKLCPDGMTGKHFGRFYTTEFIQRCLEVGHVDGEITVDVLKNIAAEVIGVLYYLILTAKTKARNDIMKSRKTLALEVYGESPIESIPGTDVKLAYLTIDRPPYTTLREYTNEQFLVVSQTLGSAWYTARNLAVSNAREQGTDMQDAEVMAIVEMMEEFYKPSSDADEGNA
ncbi:hypothetical protein EW026_g6839 [Hermanssonia centrifuga]|uniref:Kinesin-like protein n=1 Tax=Hermanssonia centrifuga TaxID=98765 RepID=A0A4S4K9R7_9APHY|nr:hypothetical protein EW026_g6839 [Hermanssonia centrifuga]